METRELGLLAPQSSSELVISVDGSFQTSHINRLQIGLPGQEILHYLLHRSYLPSFLLASKRGLLEGTIFQGHFVYSQDEIVDIGPLASG
jgi:hypothetical protein